MYIEEEDERPSDLEFGELKACHPQFEYARKQCTRLRESLQAETADSLVSRGKQVLLPMAPRNTCTPACKSMQSWGPTYHRC